jgi:hypothetical protein
MTWLRRWWFIGVALVGLTTAWVQLKAEVSRKVDRDAFDRMARDVAEMKYRLEDMDTRQRAWFCKDQPAWCR